MDNTVIVAVLSLAGTLIDGSVTGDYCVVKTDNAYYYYEKV